MKSAGARGSGTYSVSCSRRFPLALHRDAEGAEKVKVVGREWPFFAADKGTCLPAFGNSLPALGSHLIEADGRLQHQQHVESVAAYVLHHPGNLFALDHRLMDRLAELLNQFAQTRSHGYLQERRPARGGAGSGMRFLYLTSDARPGQLGIRPGLTEPFGERRCYHHIGYETANHRPHAGHRAPRRGTHRRTAHGRCDGGWN